MPRPSLRRLGPKSQALLTHLQEAGPTPVKDLKPRFPACHDSLRRLAARGLIGLEDRTRLRTHEADASFALTENTENLTLVPGQEQALASIVAGIDRGEFTPFLLHGVTASGKTEVYLSAAAHALARGRQVLVLVPEIALTHPVGQAFRRRFGSRVALLHSGLSEAFRVDQWRRIMVGEVDIVVGARSAVFAPLPRLGLVVVDEEHDPSYKQEGGLLYQARDVALYRGKLAGAAVVLVSATPQVTSCHYAREGKYRYLKLDRRVTPQTLPEIQLVDLRTQRGDKSLKVISRPLHTALEEVLRRGEQALLFLNRRGYSRAVFCLFCGQVFQCRHCSVALTHHQDQDRLVCHYCGYTEAVPDAVPPMPVQRHQTLRGGHRKGGIGGETAFPHRPGGPPGPGYGPEQRPGPQGLASLCRRGPGLPGGHPDDHQGPPFPPGHAGGGHRRGHSASSSRSIMPGSAPSSSCPRWPGGPAGAPPRARC